MKMTQVRRIALALPEVTEAPHHHLGSFRVRGRIFVTVPPGQTHLHVLVGPDERDHAIALAPQGVQPLPWGRRVLGLRVALDSTPPALVRQLLRQAWDHKAPSALRLAAAATSPHPGTTP